MKKYYYDKEAADKAVRFIEKFLTHTKGELAGKPFILEKWQKKEIIQPIFGMKHTSTGLRRYRTAFIFLPRKNGKSTLAAAIILTLMFIDDEQGAEYYSAANDREQAGIVFECCKKMASNSPELSQYLESFRNSLVYNAKGSFYKAISRESGTKHGFNVSAAIYDELHAMKSGDAESLYQVLETATGSRREPIIISITTSGFDMQSECYKLYSYAKRVREGSVKDEAFLPVIYEADREDDIQSPATWAKANPNYGISLKEDYMQREALKAMTLPSYELIFRRLHLNQWTASETCWISDHSWTDCDATIDQEILKNYPCCGALDLANNRDLSAFALVWEIDDTLIYKHWTFVPEDKVHQRTGGKDGVNYLEWADHLEITNGDVADHNYIQAKIMQLGEIYNIQSIAFDRHFASQLVIKLMDEGFNMSPFGQGYKSFNPPTLEFEKRILEQKVIHFNCPVLRWQIGNAVLELSNTDQMKITKGKAKDKIDTIIAMIMATGELLFGEREKASVYTSQQGLRSV